MILLANDSWEIKNSKIKGRGVFAAADIAPGTVIGDYLGKVINTAMDDTTEKDDLYLMYYHDYASIVPADPKASGIHLLNHSCTPNSWVYTYKGHTLVFSLRKIFKGEELTVSYLLSPGDEFCKSCTHICKCRSKFCKQTMHLSEERFLEWSKFNEAQAKKTKRVRVRYGKILPKLTSYPDKILDHEIYSLFGFPGKPSISLNNIKFPTAQELRKLIRETGRTLEFPKLKVRVFGVESGEIITESYGW